MFIKSICLRNIRSYIDQKIDFQKGITMLSGDIGSGKSTILLAIEFALFGIKRGTISGTSLLRKGESDGEVILTFVINETEVEIRRTLKKTTNSVNQDSGFIRVGNNTYEGTAIELKQRILEILNYPQELLTKNKEDIFEYTVYTPQERMKQILFLKKEERLDTLRRIFDIDKYKIISNNCQLLLTRSRYKIRELQSSINGLEQKKVEEVEVEKNKKEVERKSEQLLPLVIAAEKNLLKKKDELIAREEDMLIIHELKKQQEINEANLRHVVQKVKEYGGRQERLIVVIKDLEEELKGKKHDNVKSTIKELTKKTTELEKELRIARDGIQDCKSKISASVALIENTAKLELCPTCKQVVTKDHKSAIEKKEMEIKAKAEKELMDLLTREKEKEELLKKQKKLIENVIEEEKEMQIVLLKDEQIKQRTKELTEIGKEVEITKKIIGTCNTEQIALSKKIQVMGDIGKEILQIKKEEELLQKEFRILEIRHVTLAKDIEKYNDVLTFLEREIANMEKQKKQLETINMIYAWLEHYFLPLMTQIEKNIMAKVHGDFSLRFRKWIGMLIDAELIGARLDYDFSPLIEQNGYDIEYEDLSGGEKTALALAYRLALNQLVTEIHGKIKSKDLMILDEPTDGFSSEQLDKLKEVLSAIKAHQIILVSHESKIESFVDHVLKISKEEHISTVNT